MLLNSINAWCFPIEGKKLEKLIQNCFESLLIASLIIVFRDDFSKQITERSSSLIFFARFAFELNRWLLLLLSAVVAHQNQFWHFRLIYGFKLDFLQKLKFVYFFAANSN